MTTQEILIQAKETKTALLLADTARKNAALLKMADALAAPEHMAEIREANKCDMEAAKGTMPDVMTDRLLLDKERIEAMAEGVRAVAKLEDPVGKVWSEIVRPNGIRIQKRAVPMGVLRLFMRAARM